METMQDYLDRNWKRNQQLLKWALDDYKIALTRDKWIAESLEIWREIAKVTEYCYW